MKSRDELIQDYIDQVLSPDDQERFDALYEEDVEFRSEVQLQQEISAILTHRLSGEEQALRSNLAEAEARYRAGKERNVVPWKRWITPLIAAACILITMKIVFFPSDSALYDLPEMRSEIVRGSQRSAEERYEEAVKAFNTKEYARSSSILSELYQSDATILQYQFYLGLSLIGEGKFDEAGQYLSTIAEGASVFKAEANYYLAVALFKSGKKEEATERLSRIDESSTIYERAQKLLDKIK